MSNFDLHSLSLQLFAEGAGDTGVMAPDAGVQGVKQEVLTDTARPLETAASDPDAEFEQLIRGKYKDQYNARVRDIVQKRLKDRKNTLEQYRTLEPAPDSLAEEHGVQTKDPQTGDIDGDLQSPQPDQVMDQYGQWITQEQQARELYPSLELHQELQNPRFQALLRAGASVEDAYLVIHRDEIIPAMMRYSADAAREKLANRIAANDIRPLETAMSAQSSAVVKQDVARMTRQQRQDIIRRVQQGEIIRF